MRKKENKQLLNKDKSCSTCVECNLYENTLPSNTYFCSDTEETINDIEQHYCDNYKAE